jgi:hypothetical protein
MTTFICINKTTGIEEYRYEADAVDPNIRFYGFDTHDHVESQATPVQTIIPENAPRWYSLIDIGPFMDRFGPAKYAIMKSKNEDVQVIFEDMRARKYIDVTGAAAVQGVNALLALVPEMTHQIAANALSLPIRNDENYALRMDYFKGEGA